VTLDLELAQLLAAQRMIEQGRQDRAVALLLDGLIAGRGQKLASLMDESPVHLIGGLTARPLLSPRRRRYRSRVTIIAIQYNLCSILW
jgi:hypothetical protein